MKIILPKTVENRLFDAIKNAANNETGGILMGEHISGDEYKIVDLTVQSTGGTFISFIRSIAETINPLKKFFKKTNHNYEKFNYLGEWHSHPPQYGLKPSNKDINSMWEIVEDIDTNANFAVLLVLQTGQNNGQIEGSATIFLPEHKFIMGELIKE